MWRLIDVGKSWKYIGLKKFEYIGRICIYLINLDLVYVVVMGNLWKLNEERGVYCFKDGGKIWEKILYESDKVGVVDFIFDFNNFCIIYVSIW